MIDLAAIGLDVNWRGYPVQYMTEGCWDALYPEVGMALAATLRNARDTAQAGEPADWLFEDASGEQTIWIERAGGYRDGSGHHGGHWCVFLPEER